MKVNKDYLCYLIYAFISFIIILSTGEVDKYIFTLDFPAGPNIFKSLVSSLYGFEAPIWGGHLVWKLLYSFLVLVFSAPLMQKILLFFILFMAGYSGYKFVPVNSKKAKFFAGLLYMFNPYTYIRIVVGHWLILFAYAMLPLALRSFIELLEKKRKKDIIKFVLMLMPVALNSHTLIIAFIAFLIIFIFWFYKSRDIVDIKNITLAGILFILLNAFWLVPFAFANNTLLIGIGSEDIAAFAPRIENFSALFTLASMYGFWRDGYLYSKDFNPYWQVLFVFILSLVVHGFKSNYEEKNLEVYLKPFGVIAISGLILAAGYNSPFSEFFIWLFDHTLLKGMRDSHKFVTLLALSYTYLGALGISNLEKKARDDVPKYKKAVYNAVIIIALLTPLLYSFTFFNGFAGQVKSADYPFDWYEVDSLLNNDHDEFKVLFFPWHQYMNFNWVPNRDKRIANPAENFFGKDVITGKNVEIGEIYRQVYSQDQAYIDFLLKKKNKILNLGELIAPLNIKYILLTREADYKKYIFLFNQSDLELVKETEKFYVFKNKHELSKIYEVQSMTYLKDWNELLERSKNEDITKGLYVIGDGLENTTGNFSSKSPGYEKKSPLEYELKEYPSKKYLIFSESYSESWELGEEKPIPAYGVVNAYEAKRSREIRYERFYDVYLPSYIITLITFILLIVFYFDLQKKIPLIVRKKEK